MKILCFGQDLVRGVGWLLILLILTATARQATAREYALRGKTMGTFYTVKLISGKAISPELWQRKIDIRLKEVNTRLSMYNPKSEISRFNRAPALEPFRISRDFRQVLAEASRIHALTDGAWDGTVKPLVDLWGFGTKNRAGTIPEAAAIESALSRTGFGLLDIRESVILKKEAGLTLDLGSIAKGFGVDAIARLLADGGIDDYLVEIGGELSGAGVNKNGKPWSVGISKPVKAAADQSLYKIVTLDNRAIATSGNYRNFFELNGRTYSHIINPKTGFPVDNRIVSASVLAPDCTFADGLATALMVMDVAAGLDLVNSLDQVDCMIIRRTGQELVTDFSRDFQAFLRQ